MKTSPELLAAYESAKSTSDTARELARTEPTAEHREAAKLAYAALDAATVACFGPRRIASYSSRAGQRQYRERRQ